MIHCISPGKKRVHTRTVSRNEGIGVWTPPKNNAARKQCMKSPMNIVTNGTNQ
jgi:hypothetical protein